MAGVSIESRLEALRRAIYLSIVAMFIMDMLTPWLDARKRDTGACALAGRWVRLPSPIAQGAPMVARSLLVAASLVAAATTTLPGQQHTFEGTVTMRSARGSQDFIMQATDNDIGNVGRLFEQPASEIMRHVETTGGTISTTELRVKGTLVRADLPQIRGYLVFDAESGNIAMVRPQYYTAFAAEELQQLMGGMMPAGVPGPLASAMGSDAAIETADIALMTDDLSKLPWLVGHSKRTLGIIRENIVFSLGVKVVFVGLTFVGFATLWGAIAADVGASLLVVANAMRLLRAGRVQ